MAGYVYILANRKNGTLYIGVTNDIYFRLQEHRANKPGSFTAKYKIHHLVYLEYFENISDAIDREKVLKKLTRKRKIALIEKDNPDWFDMSHRLIDWID